jgi:hypothetical protein
MSEKQQNNIDRRSFLQHGLAGAGAAGLAASLMPGQDKPSKPIRIGVIGVGPRGQWHVKNLLTNHPDVTVAAICDIQEDHLRKAIDMVKEMRGAEPAGYSKGEFDYRNLCQRDDLEAVLIATPVYWLGRMTVDALRAGKHAALEVAGPQTEEECWDMVREKQKSGKHVMLLENCCYGNENMMVYSMIKQGAFGDPYYAEGSYVHDCRSMFFDAAGKITWRLELQRDRYGSTYPQHGLGSNCKWLEINDGDRLESCQTMMATAGHEAHLRTVRQFGPDSEQARIQFKEGDFVTSLISTAKGRMIRLDYSICCTRPYSRYYLLQVTKGCWDSRSGVFLEVQLGAEQYGFFMGTARKISAEIPAPLLARKRRRCPAGWRAWRNRLPLHLRLREDASRGQRAVDRCLRCGDLEFHHLLLQVVTRPQRHPGRHARFH